MPVDSALQQRAIDGFRQHAGRDPQWLTYAPGRVNLLGDHADYNQGWALPCAIPFGSIVAMAPRVDGRVRVVALDLANSVDEFAMASLQPLPAGSWANHVRGVFAALQQGDSAARLSGGFDLVLAGNVPQGAGLSSSTSLSVAVAIGLFQSLGVREPEPLQLAQLVEGSERRYAGYHRGVIDPLVSMTARGGHATLVNCATLERRAVPLPQGSSVLIVHSGVQQGSADAAAEERRRECETAAEVLGAASLRELTLAQLLEKEPELEPRLVRRARHVITENSRTVAAAEALGRNDLALLGTVMAESHASLRDDFEVTLPELDDLADAMQEAMGGKGGVRMTGTGFGGCLVAVVATAAVPMLRTTIQNHFRAVRKAVPFMTVVQPAHGARRL
ncbi:MAG: galactokinase [Sinobacteraceae bacterium]|nr:galactokinase [Nevskiaceae bacterium]